MTPSRTTAVSSESGRRGAGDGNFAVSQGETSRRDHGRWDGQRVFRKVLEERYFASIHGSTRELDEKSLSSHSRLATFRPTTKKKYESSSR